MITRRSTLLIALAATAARAESAAAAPIAAFGAALIGVMRQGRATPFAARAQALGPAVDGAFDLATILRASVGLRWGGIAPATQAQLLAAFRDFSVATWVANFDEYAGERFEVEPTTRKAGADEVVTTRIRPASGDPTRLDYVMHQGAEGWRAVDILLDGTISRVAVQRSDFRAILAKGETALLDMLRAKAAELAAGGK